MASLRIWEQVNIPNLFSLMRPASLIFIFWWWQPNSLSTLVCIGLIGITDGLDGWWARRYNAQTPLGVQLDPIADKLFAWGAFAYVAYSTTSEILWVLVGLMIFYDIFNTVSRRKQILYALKGEYYTPGRMESDRGVSLLSKAKTAYLFFLLVVLVPDGTQSFMFVPVTVIAAVQTWSIWLGVLLILICLHSSYVKTSTRGKRNRLRGVTSSER